MSTAGVIVVGFRTGPSTYIDSTGIALRNSSTIYVNMTTAGVITLGATTGGNVYISSSGIAIRDATTTYINLDTSGNATFGRTGGTYANAIWNASNSRLEFRTNTTVKSYIDTDGALVIKTGTGYGRVNAITFNDGTSDVVDLSCYSNAGSHFVRLYTYALSGHTADILVQANTNSAYPSQVTISATNSVGGDQAYVECRADSTMSIIELNADDVHVYDGDLHYWYELRSHRAGGNFAGYIFVPLSAPLTSTSWDGDSRSTTAKTKIDLSAVFGAPAEIKAVYVKVGARDSASSTSDCYIIFADNNTAGSGVVCEPWGRANDTWEQQQMIVKCDVNGDIYYQILATGSLTFDCWISIWGYFV
jgi:hypothetical protein